MGMLTVVVLHNDAMGAFQEDPKAFGEAILRGVDQANMNARQASVGFKNYANYIHVEPSRHADHNVLWISSGNCVHVIGSHEHDWDDLCKRNPECANSFHDKAKDLLKWAKKRLDLLAGKK